jgi:hypothetical protein
MTRSFKGHASIRAMLRLMVAVVILMVPAIAAAPQASAGISVCLGLWANDGRIKVQHQSRCGPNGVYHVHVWDNAHSSNSPAYIYTGGIHEAAANWPSPAGTKVCAELWFHELNGRYSSWGLPCDTM